MIDLSVFERLKDIIKRSVPVIDLDNITMESSFKNDLGLDSLTTMMISIIIEEEFDFTFDGSIDFETVRDICEYIEAKIK